MTPLSDHVATLIDEQRRRIESMRELLDSDADVSTYRELFDALHASDELIHSIAAVAEKLNSVKMRPVPAAPGQQDRPTGG